MSKKQTVEGCRVTAAANELSGVRPAGSPHAALQGKQRAQPLTPAKSAHAGPRGRGQRDAGEERRMNDLTLELGTGLHGCCTRF